MLTAYFFLLPTAHCPLTTVQAQMHSVPQDSTVNDTSSPAILRGVTIEQRYGEQLPLDATFRDELGNDVKLGDYFGEKPVMLAFVYYQCPMLCNEVLNGTLGTLKALPFTAGKEFDIVAISFDARENDLRGLAAEKKASYIERYNRPGASEGWHFLTGTQDSIRRVTDAAGFGFEYDEKLDQFAHAAGIMIVTPDGKMSRYFYGIEYAPKDIRLGLVEAADGKIGTPVDKLLLYCFHYDPATGKYGAVVMNMIRIAGVALLIGLGLFYVLVRRYKPSRVREGMPPLK